MKKIYSIAIYYFKYSQVNKKIYKISFIAMQKPFFKFTEAVNDNGTVWYTIQVHAKGSDPQPIIIK